MSNKPVKVIMWMDLNGKAWNTEKTCQQSNNTILEKQEYSHKERIISSHVDIAFDDWLKFTDQDRALDMRSGAVKMIWYFINNDFFKKGFFND